jgi:hypothetical protein
MFSWIGSDGYKICGGSTRFSVLISRKLPENGGEESDFGRKSFGVAKRLEFGKFYPFVLKVFNCVTE